MVQVKWRKTALRDLEKLLERAYFEYGQRTMNNHIELLEQIQERITQGYFGIRYPYLAITQPY